MTTGEPGFLFSGHETIFGRAGLGFHEDDITPNDYIDAMKEIEDLYKRKYGYWCVRVIRNKNDPLMCDVWVIPNAPYATNMWHSGDQCPAFSPPTRGSSH